MPSKLIRLYGIVQGVGFRPFVKRTADKFFINGTVSNKGSYVEVFALGNESNLKMFLKALETDAPERSTILKIDVKDIDSISYKDFKIIDSERESGDIFVSPDIATCDKCKQELFDKNNRRYLHPFINCTACGPRLTILDSMPYDRERTSMGEFKMCSQCEYEYTHKETRRFDAQPVCCNDCGPQVYILGTDLRNDKAITFTRKSIMDGKIVAIKGIGGFHLCCDARNNLAVKRLRELKHRPQKPFAVMMKDLSTVEKECVIENYQSTVLDGHQKPIILLKKKKNFSLSESLSPDNPTLGVMLPYAPIQMLLFKYDDSVKMTDSLVMTSGNVSGAPICRSDEDAKSEILSFCDLILSHNRKIRIRADDSVMDFFDGKPYMIRRSRGYAPLPFILSKSKNESVLAIGGELKNTFCLGKNSIFYPSPYVGDMADIRTVNALKESIQRMETLLEIKPSVIACDLHPLYNTTVVAEELSKTSGIPLIKIQHHYAHILSCMAENDFDDDVLGISFDGTGYGLDDTIWGGEILKANYHGFERLGSIKPFYQVGGDISSKEGSRIAISLLGDIYKDKALTIIEKLNLGSAKQANLQFSMAKNNINSIKSTSVGRLFDAVSAILGIRLKSSFEGEASTSLMFSAMRYKDKLKNINNKYEIEIINDFKNELISTDNNFITLETKNLVKYITDLKLSGLETDRLSFIFHLLMAQMIVDACKKARENTGISVCALSGGVFQNKLLLELCSNLLKENNFKVLLHSLVPPNDGGISLGQAAFAMYNINN